MILDLIGWKLTLIGDYPYEYKRKVMVAGPHTSNWDFPLGILIRTQLREPVMYVGKAALFKPPFGWLFYKLGGIPVDRSKSTNFVQQVTEFISKKERATVLLAGEGKRKRVDKFKTGFYYIAQTAQIPILPVILDYDTKEFRIGPLVHPTDDDEADIQYIESLFKGVRGKIKEYSFYPDHSESESE